MGFKFFIRRNDVRLVAVNPETHILLKIYAKKKNVTLREATEKVISAGLLADKEFSKPFRDKYKIK